MKVALLSAFILLSSIFTQAQEKVEPTNKFEVGLTAGMSYAFEFEQLGFGGSIWGSSWLMASFVKLILFIVGEGVISMKECDAMEICIMNP